MQRRYKPTAKGYFSGCGGFEIGAIQAGVRMLQSLDIDPGATEIMKANPGYFSHDILTGDIKDVKVKDQPDTDIIISAYPCTKYSSIADIRGTRTGDDLFLHFFRHVAIERPEMYIVENVPGMKKFPVVMEAMTKLPEYFVSVVCPVNASNWLPQERKRLIIIGTRKPLYVFHPTHGMRPKLKQILEKDPVYEIPDYVKTRLNGGYRDRPIIVDPDNPNALAPTCVAHYSKDLSTRMVKHDNEYGARPFTIREYARLQGFPDDFVFPEKRSSYMYIGNAVPVDMGRWACEQAIRYFN